MTSIKKPNIWQYLKAIFYIIWLIISLPYQIVRLTVQSVKYDRYYRQKFAEGKKTFNSSDTYDAHLKINDYGKEDNKK